MRKSSFNLVSRPDGTLKQPAHSGNDPIKIDCFRCHTLLSRKGEELRRKSCSALSRGERCGKQSSRGLVTGIESRPQQFKIAQDRCQQIIEVVRDPASKLADGLQ